MLQYEQFDNIISETSGIMAEQCGLSIDTIIRNAMVAGATAAYPSDVSAVASLDSPAHDISYKDIVKQIFALQASNALPVEGGRFIILMHPHTLATLFNDSTFVDMFIQGSQEELKSGKMGTILNADIYVSANCYEVADGGVGSTTDYYQTFFIGKLIKTLKNWALLADVKLREMLETLKSLFATAQPVMVIATA